MILRWYQEQAVAAIFDYLRQTKDGAPVAVLPTGAGKTPVLAELCRQVVAWNGRAIVLAHVKELLEQNAEKLRMFMDSDIVGVYSAGLNERTTDTPVVVAGIQSVYQRADELGPFQLIIVDEAHLVPTDGDGRYRTFIEEARRVNPSVRLVGLTATPWRLGSGWITADHGDEDGKLFTEVVYEVSVRDLISAGFLSPVVSKNAKKSPDFSGVHIKRGDFAEEEVEKVLNGKNVLESACMEIVEESRDRSRVLVFCNRVESARRCASLLREYDDAHDVAVVDGTTSANERADVVRRFKQSVGDANLFGENAKPLKYVCNVGVLTTGFDAPNVDVVAILRPTQSISLYHQIVGRGLRRAEGKDDCLILDYGGNVERHGPIDLPQVEREKRGAAEKAWKTCAFCGAVVSLKYPTCPICGVEFSKPEKQRDPNKKLAYQADRRDIVSDGENAEDETIESVKEVTAIEYDAHYKKDSDKPPTLQVTYRTNFSHSVVREWLCPEHDGFARKKFEKWWKEKSNVEPPHSAEVAANYARSGALAVPMSIKCTCKKGDHFWKVEWRDVGPIPTDFDATKVKTASDDFEEFDEFGAFADPIEDETSERVDYCRTCRSWSPEDHTGDDFDAGFCCRLEDSKRGNERACERYDYRDDDSDLPF